MLEFKKLTLSDIEKIRPYFLYSANRTCDNTVGGTFMWRDYFNTEYALFNNSVVFKAKLDYYDGAYVFAYPLGEDVLGCIYELEDYCNSRSIPLIFCKITQDELNYVKSLFSNTRVTQESNWSDYLYNAQDLIVLAGRRYHGQRNHINYFKRTYSDYTFEVIDKNNLGDVKDFYKNLTVKAGDTSKLFLEDQEKTFEVLNNFETYNLPGGLIRIGENVVAFSVGEICSNTLFVHIEKADINYRGAYQVINNEFAIHYASSGIKYINREDDSGDPGLRIAKESYHPVRMIDKYIVEVL